MINLGISIYPDKSKLEDDLKYIELAGKYNVKRVFTNLLGLGGKSKEEIKEEFTSRIDLAHKYNMEVIVDVSPKVFDDLGISYDDLSFFNEIGADGIRLDQSFGGQKEAIISYNPYGLKLELNASGSTQQLDSILSFKPNREKIIASHNFYPQRHAGLALDFFVRNSLEVKKHNLYLSAFISSNTKDAYGPWPVTEGLCTLEMHRDLPIDLQARHLMALGFIDNVTIANVYASEDEFKSLRDIVQGKINIKVIKEYELSDIEEKILYYDQHFVRGDLNDNVRRSTMTRVIYRDYEIEPKNTRDLKRGDVVIVNEEYGQYKGELHIVLKDMENQGNKNVVARIKEEELILLDSLDSWNHFVIMK